MPPSSEIKSIQTDKAPAALGHYEQGIISNGMIYTSMQLPINPDSPDDRPEDIKDIARQLIANIFEIVKAGGADISSIIKVTVYVTDISYWEPMNEIYTEMFGSHKCARSVVTVKELHKGWPLAMEAVAQL